MHKPKAFVIITPGFAADESDDCIPMHQSFVRTLSEQMRYTKILIISLHYPFRADHYRWHDAEVFSLNGRNRGGVFTNMIRQKAYNVFKSLHAQYSVSNILSFWYGEAALTAERLAQKYQLEHKCWILGQDARINNKYPPNLHLRPHRLIALSDFIQEEFFSNFNVKPAYVIPPGINSGHVSFTETEKDIDVIGVGSLIGLKQYEVFIDIIVRLKMKFPSVKAVLIGDGEEREKLAIKIRANGLEQNIVMKGKLTHEQVMYYLSRSKILLHTSSYEAFGVVCIEALFAGAKVISFVQPMMQAPQGWTYVKNPTEMLDVLLCELEKSDPIVQRIPFRMRETVENVVNCFNRNDHTVKNRLSPVNL